MKFRLLLFFALSFFQLRGFGSHVLGGYISYKHDTLNRYEIYVHLYRDCRGIAMDSSPSGLSAYFLNTSKGQMSYISGIPLTRIAIRDISILKPGTKSPCDPGNTNNSGTGAELHLFRAMIDFDSTSYSTYFHSTDLGSIRFVYSHCCYNGPITGNSATNLWLETEMIVRFPDSTTNFGATSPEMLMHHPPFMCCNAAQFKDFGMQDTIDHDSIRYYLTPLKTSYGQNLSYASPFSYQYPFTPYCIPASKVNCSPNPTSDPPKGIYFDTNSARCIFTPTKCDEFSILSFQALEYKKSGGNYYIASKTDYAWSLWVLDNCGYNFTPKISLAPKNVTFAIDKPNSFDLESSNVLFSPYQSTDTTDFFFPNVPHGSRYTRNTPFAAIDKGKFEWTPDENWYGKKLKLVCAVKDRPAGGNPGYYTQIVNVDFRGQYSDYSLLTFLDKNNNGLKDSAEVILPNVRLAIQFSNGKVQYRSSDGNGILKVPVFSNYKIIKTIPGSNWFQTLVFDTLHFYGKDSAISGVLPLHSFPFVKGRLYYDINNNCNQDSLDPFAENLRVYSYNSATQTTDSGEFILYLDTSSSFVKFTGFQDSDSCQDKTPLRDIHLALDTFINVGNISIKSLFDLEPVLSTGPIRRGRKFDTWIRLYNNSRADLKYYADTNYPSLFLKYDPGLLLLNTSLAADIDSIQGLIKWKCTNITRMGSVDFKATFNVPSDSFMVGDALQFRVYLDSSFSDDNKNNNAVFINNRIIGPYDPNKKMLLCADSLPVTERIIYHIDFQNLGSDTAFQVVVTDTLDPSVDPVNIRLLQSSSPCITEIRKGVLIFTFPNATLTDTATDKEKSKGFVSFQACLRMDIKSRENVKNTASIYFDYEKPVPTNSVSLKVLPNTETFVGASYYCRSDTLKYAYRNHIMNSATECILELDKAGSNFTTAMVLDKFTHPIGENVVQRNVLLPDSIASGSYQLRVVPVDWSKTGFLEASSVFFIEKQIPEWHANLELCAGELLKINMDNGSSADIYLNDSLMAKQTQFYSFYSSQMLKYLRLSANSKNNCPWRDSAVIQVNPLPSVTIKKPEFTCHNTPFFVQTNPAFYYSVYQNKQLKYLSAQDSVFAFIPMLGKDFLHFIVASDRGCMDSVDVWVKQRHELTFTASVPVIDCTIDSVLLTLSGDYLFSAKQSGKRLLENFRGTGFYLKPYNRDPLFITATDSFMCQASDSIGFPQAEHYNLLLNASADSICVGDSVFISFSGMPGAEFWVNDTNTGNLQENKAYSIHKNAGTHTLQVQQHSSLGCLYRSNKMDLFVAPIPATPTISRKGDTLFSSSPYHNHWYLNNLAMDDTLQYHIPISDGFYSVETRNKFGCSAFSNAIHANWTSTSSLNNDIGIFPNPFGDNFTILSKNQIHKVMLFDGIGNLVLTQQLFASREEIHGGNIPGGVYCLRIFFTNGTSYMAWIQKN